MPAPELVLAWPWTLRAWEQAGLPVELHLLADSEPPADVVRAVHRLCQEALTNVLRHAGSVPVRIEVRAGDGELHVSVVDDGPPARLGSGHGLLGMRERVQGFGGELVAGPRAEGGFSVTARLPLHRPAG